jgi:hypothetical protein
VVQVAVKGISTLLLIAFVAGCATPPPRPVYLQQKEANKELILSSKQIEIIYHPDEYSVVDIGGTKAQGLLGALGPVGLLAGFAALIAHSATKESRAESRSAELTKLMADHYAEQSLNKEFATQISTLLQGTGHTTLLTPLPLSADSVRNYQGTEGYAQLWLRTSLGYGAASLTDSFKPVVLVEYTLKDSTGKRLTSRTYTKYFTDSDHTFLTYSSLLSGYQQAHDELQTRLAEMSKPMYTEVFEFSDDETVASK